MSEKKKHPTKVDELKEALEKRKKMGGDVEAKVEVKDEVKVEVEKDELKELAEGLRAAEEEAKAHYDKLLRVMAELDNFKKRSEREKLELLKYSNEKLIKDLLPVLDDIDRVLDHLPEEASQELHDFVEGVQLVGRQFRKVLEQYGLREIYTDGEKFNPEFHEAVAHIPNDKVCADYIIAQHRKGYILNDRVIRAALVSVSSGNSE